MSGFDIIGDVHGCADELEDLLRRLGYGEDSRTGGFHHPERQAVFVGDLIDRGPAQLRVLALVRAMTESGAAQVVMGNHEFNAIAFATPNPAEPAEFLRRHTEKNVAQHQSFLDQVSAADRAYYIAWFKSLPLWLDLGEIRVVHACWHADSMRLVRSELGGNRFTSAAQFVRASTEGDPLFGAVEVLLKGPEIGLTEHGQPPFLDKDGHRRERVRLRWWREGATTLRELAELSGRFTNEAGDPYPSLPEIEVPAAERSFAYADDVPVFYGHYWRLGNPQEGIDWTPHTACVDFSAVRTHSLVAYRWSGESTIRPGNYVLGPS